VLKNLIWVVVAVVALVLVGSLVLSLLGLVVKLAFYLIVGAVVVFGGLWVVGKVRKGIPGRSDKQLR
jgi:hypothetical protein